MNLMKFIHINHSDHLYTIIQVDMKFSFSDANKNIFKNEKRF